MKKSSKILIVIIIAFMVCLCLGVFYYLIVKNPINSNNNKQATSEENVISNEGPKEDKEGEIHLDKAYALITREVFVNGEVLSEEQTDLEVYEYRDLEDYDEILYCFRGYTTDPSFKYEINIKDENDNDILIEESTEGAGNVIVAKIENVTLEQILTFTVTEILDNEEQEITKIFETKINFKKDIEEIQKIDQISTAEERTLGDIKFKYIKDENADSWPITHAYSNELKGEIFSSSIGVQYGNTLLNEESFDFFYKRNVNNLSLEEAFEKLNIIKSNAGEYGLSDVYGLYICDDEGEILDTIEVSFEEMLKLCNGEEIEFEGVKYTSENFDFVSEIEYVQKEKIKIAGIDAIKYYVEDNETQYYYMFEYTGNIYEIRLPNSEKLEEEVEFILNSMEIIK